MSSDRTLSMTSTSWVLPALGPVEFTVAELQDANRRADVTIKAAPIPRPTKREGPLLPTLAMFQPVLLNALGPLGGIRPIAFLPSEHDRNNCAACYRRGIAKTEICEQLSRPVSYDCHVSV
jgi:hypothetical protein